MLNPLLPPIHPLPPFLRHLTPLLHQPRPRNLMFRTQLPLPNKQTHNQPRPRKRHIHDPHDLDRPRKGLLRHYLLSRRQLLHDPDARTRRAAREQLRGSRPQRGRQPAVPLLHLVLEDHAADDDRDGRRQVAREAEGRDGRGDVARRHPRLQRDQRRLEVGPDADAGHDLEEDDLGPVVPGAEVDEQAEAERHDGEAEVDGRQVLPGLLDVDAGEGGDEGEGEGEGDEVDAGEERAATQHGLEVKGEIVRPADEGKAVAEADAERGDIGAVLEDAQRHDRVARELPLVEHEEPGDDDAEDDEADDLGRAPGVRDAAELEAEQEHQCAADDGEAATPIDGFQAIPDGRLGVMKTQEEEEEDGDRSGDGYYHG